MTGKNTPSARMECPRRPAGPGRTYPLVRVRFLDPEFQGPVLGLESTAANGCSVPIPDARRSPKRSLADPLEIPKEWAENCPRLHFKVYVLQHRKFGVALTDFLEFQGWFSHVRCPRFDGTTSCAELAVLRQSCDLIIRSCIGSMRPL
jgi:hypothetical protein